MNKRYNIVYADPPWSFATYSAKGKEKKSAELHYNCMTTEDIYNLPVQNICADDCILFLWVTNPMLKQGLETIERWGFTYKTVGFNWFKKNKIADSWFWGLGYYVRQNTEMCLLATKGNPKRVSKGVHQVVEYEDIDVFDTEQINERVSRHSEKPLIVANRIVELMGDLPRVELFARTTNPGWDSIGYEIDGRDIKDVLDQKSQ